jgi:hypothetical protein
MKIKHFIFIFGLIGLIVQFSCSDEPATPNDSTIDQSICDSLNPTYNRMIAALVNGNCAFGGCHDVSGAGGYKLTNYEEVKAAAQTDKFLKAIKHEAGASPMPKNGTKFSESNIQLFECWIQNGFPESE